MAAGTLYTYPENFRAYKALIAAKYSGFDLKVSPDFKWGVTNKSDVFLKKFPLGKVPAFEGSDGITLVESNAIAHYVASDALRGSNVKDASQVQQWVNFADSEILPASCTWVFPVMGIMQYNKQNTDRAKEDVNNILALLNSHLATRTFLVGERISLADISVACNLLQLYQWVLEPEFRGSYTNANRWFVTMVNQPNVKTIIGDFKLCTKMGVFDAKKFKETQGKPAKEKKEKKAPQPKAEPKPKLAADDDDGEDAPKKPSKDPFASLIKGKFDYDEWKRTYSNNDTIKVALPYFWENFEKENMSLWSCEYKFPEQLGQIFMSCNLIGGMMQRLDRMRKHAFGSVILFGESDNSTISGVWFWRGQDLAFTLSEDLQVDYESYDWKKLDPDAEETKLLVKEYFSHTGNFGGKKFQQGKIYK